MNPRTIERASWTLGIGGFLAVLLGALLSPDPTAFRPFAVGSLVVALPLAHWYVGRQLDEFPSESAGRLTLFFLASFAVSYLGFAAVDLVAAPDTTAEAAGRIGATLIGLAAARRVAYRGGYDRLRAALSG